MKVEVLVTSTLCDPMGSTPPDSSAREDSPGKNTGVGSHSLFQGIFPTHRLNPGLLHCRQILYSLSHQGRSFMADTRRRNFDLYGSAVISVIGEVWSTHNADAQYISEGKE